MRVLRWIGIGLVVVVAALVVAGMVARGRDGPLGPFPGGPLQAGERVDEPVADWSFITELREAELQLLEPPRSRTTWLVVHEGALYIPCGFPNQRWLKQWPHEAVRDGRALLRVAGQLYPVTLVRVTDDEPFVAINRLLAEKYGLGDAAPDHETTWIFRLDPRSETPG